MLNPLELTGRAATHVRRVPELACTLHPEAAAALLAMREAARGDGLDLMVVSGFRDFGAQAAIWNAKYRGERLLLDDRGEPLDRTALDERALLDAILRWSALPGASRHHWGTDVDLVDRAALPPGGRPRLLQQEFAPGGPFARLEAWLTAHMAGFGYYRPFAADRGGVGPEPWHLSYAPIAGPALGALTLEVLTEAVAAGSFDGREQVLVRLPEIYARYVRNVEPPPAMGRFTPSTTPS